jgi:hypothetical protein
MLARSTAELAVSMAFITAADTVIESVASQSRRRCAPRRSW